MLKYLVSFKPADTFHDMFESFQNNSGDNNSSSQIKERKNLEWCFRSILNDLEVNLKVDNLFNIIVNDLRINIDKIDRRLCRILPHMVVYHIKTYPDWNEVHNSITKCKGTEKKMELFSQMLTQFKDYLLNKINDIIRNKFDGALKEVAPELGGTLHLCETPFKLKISGPPEVLNNIVFEGAGNDLAMIIQPLSSSRPDCIKLSQLINWPFFSVTFESKELLFSRHIVPDYVRHIKNDRIDFNWFMEENIICSANPINKSKPVNMIGYNVFRDYYTQYLRVLQKIPNIDHSRIDEIKIILFEFLKDVNEICRYTCIGTNSRVTFHLGGYKYFKANQSSNILFGEIVTPKVEVQLLEFDGNINMNNGQASFDHLNYFENIFENYRTYINNPTFLQNTVNCFLPRIVYKCNFCKETFGYENGVQVFLHFVHKHSTEAIYKCLKCQNPFDFLTIIQDRWIHNCPLPNSNRL